MPLSGIIFAGVTIGPVREELARQVKALGPARVIAPCAGRFAAIEAIVRGGFPAERVEASDITLFSSILGYLCDPTKRLSDLQIGLQERHARFVAGATDDLTYAAGVMLLMRYLQIPPKAAYTANHRREILANIGQYRDALRDQLRAFTDVLGGLRYEVADVRDEVMRVKDDGEAFLYANVPGYGGGYTKMFEPVNEAITWAAPAIDEFDPEEISSLFWGLEGVPLRAVLYGLDPALGEPEGWRRIFAHTVDPSKRVDYLLANYDPATIGVSYTRRDVAITPLEIYAEQEITPASVVTFLKVDRDTALYYRDLFVHKLGTTSSEVFYLMLIDGRVVTALGLHLSELRRASSDYAFEIFGISISSKRYKRLGKLFMLCLTSGDFKRQLMHDQARSLTFREPKGIRTASPTTNHEGKTDRSVMKLVKREPRPGGGFQLTYEGDFRDDTWADCLAEWCARWGDLQRDAAATPPTKKKKRRVLEARPAPVTAGAGHD